MRGKPYPERIRTQVLALGASGKTYEEIQHVYPVPKATLSYWFWKAGQPKKRNRTEQLEILKRARAAAHTTIRNKRLARLSEAHERAKQEANTIDFTNVGALKSMLAMLYWAEGTKSDKGSMIFANTDPILISFYLRLLRTSFPLDESKLRIRLHLHHYHKRGETRRFWSELLRVPESQFGKIHAKKRSARKKFRRNFRGICFVVYHDTAVRREIMALGTQLAEILEKRRSRRSMDRT